MIEELKKVCRTETEIDLVHNNTYRIHSIGYAVVYPSNMMELKSVFSIVKKYKTKYLVLGNGSNVILPDYYVGVIIKLKIGKCIVTGNKVYVPSWYMLNKLAINLSEKGYTGLEWATGIPGTIGGAIYGNAEAYKIPISSLIDKIMIFDGEKEIEYSPEDMHFGYRTSILKGTNNLIILGAVLNLEKGNKEEIKSLIKDRTKRRIETQPLEYPSCGSVFRNPSDNYAGKLIEDLGLKGYRVNDAMVSKKHANFIINTGNATSKDIISIIKKIKKEVKKSYKINLIEEVEIIK